MERREKIPQTLERTLDLHANPDEIDETGETRIPC